jgi:hypothetical protein
MMLSKTGGPSQYLKRITLSDTPLSLLLKHHQIQMAIETL